MEPQFTLQLVCGVSMPPVQWREATDGFRAGVVCPHQATFPINAISRSLSGPPLRTETAIGLARQHGLFPSLLTAPKRKEHRGPIVQCSVGFFLPLRSWLIPMSSLASGSPLSYL